jgi:hypothetical protein
MVKSHLKLISAWIIDFDRPGVNLGRKPLQNSCIPDFSQLKNINNVETNPKREFSFEVGCDQKARVDSRLYRETKF